VGVGGATPQISVASPPPLFPPHKGEGDLLARSCRRAFPPPRAAFRTELPPPPIFPGRRPGAYSHAPLEWSHPWAPALRPGKFRGWGKCGGWEEFSVGKLRVRESGGGRPPAPSPPCRAPSPRRGEGFRWGADGEANPSSFAPSGRRWREAPDEGATHRTAPAFPLPKPKTLSYKLLLRSRYREASYDRYARFPGRSIPLFRDYGQAAPLGRSRKVTTIRT